MTTALRFVVGFIAAGCCDEVRDEDDLSVYPEGQGRLGPVIGYAVPTR